MLHGYKTEDYTLPRTGVAFQTSDKRLQALYDRCEALCRENLKPYDDRVVLQEGSQYKGVWLETQPMGGEMYAKRNMEAALNNILIFPHLQRPDGRYPGMIRDEGRMGIGVHYCWLQGFYLGIPALRMAYHLGLDKRYMRLMYDSIQRFDQYLWAYRDSNGDGLLESFCTWDTGEDHAQRFLAYGAQDGGFGGEKPPKGHGKLPYASMEMMGFSCQARLVLAEFARLLGSGEEAAWKRAAQEVRDRVYAALWDAGRGACFDRSCDGQPLPVLSHVNLRCMYHRLFSQEMADEFIQRHLMNPEEFYTPVPLPSTAANDPLYRSADSNNWSGPCQGLTYQRAADALLHYGHYAEAALLGRKWLDLLIRTGRLVQQYDPFDGTPGQAEDGYGPTMLAALEYISLLYGINIRYGRVLFGGVQDGSAFSYTQQYGNRQFTLIGKGTEMTASADGRELFTVQRGVSVETDLQGRIRRVVGIDEKPVPCLLQTEDAAMRCVVAPNEQWAVHENKLVLQTKIPFAKPTQTNG